MRFRTKIVQGSKTATGIVVPDDVVTALGGGKRPKVTVTLNGYTYRSSIAPMGGHFMVGVSASVRSAAGVAGGDELDIDIDLDLEPRRADVPRELHAALTAEPDLLRRFEGLSYSNQVRLAGPVAAAKTAETRQRRIDKACDELRRS
jgi:hypothetical protein